MGKKEPILVGFLYVAPGRGEELTDLFLSARGGFQNRDLGELFGELSGELRTRIMFSICAPLTISNRTVKIVKKWLTVAKTLEFNEAEQSLIPPAFRLFTG